MPQLIEHIDAIARQKQRAVLYIKFSDPENPDWEIKKSNSTWNWESSVGRQFAWSSMWRDENYIAIFRVKIAHMASNNATARAVIWPSIFARFGSVSWPAAVARQFYTYVRAARVAPL